MKVGDLVIDLENPKNGAGTIQGIVNISNEEKTEQYAAVIYSGSGAFGTLTWNFMVHLPVYRLDAIIPKSKLWRALA